jgi:hypothetical protein
MAVAKIKINKKSIKTAANNALKKGGKARKIVEQKARQIYDQRKKRLLAEFDNHPITREIASGPSASNSSGTLGGYGNLFSFIGFDSGSDPVGKLRRGLINSISFVNRPIVKKGARGPRFEFRIKVPTQRELKDFTPMPWEPGSWMTRIEQGISGLGYYIYQNFSSGSRSGKGKQSSNQMNKGVTYRRTTYMSKLLRDFIRSKR